MSVTPKRLIARKAIEDGVMGWPADEMKLRLTIAEALRWTSKDQFGETCWYDERGYLEPLPDWHDSVDDALTLPLAGEAFWTLQPKRAHGEAHASLYPQSWDAPWEADAEDGNLALAMCRAWLLHVAETGAEE